MISPSLDAVSSELSLAVRASRTLLAHSLQHNHGTPCMHLLAYHIFSVSSSPRLLSLDALYLLAESENGQIPGMCTLGSVFRDGIPDLLPASLPRAAALWRKAVSAYGCALSSYLLARAAEAGAGVDRRPALAAVLYEGALLAEGFGFAAAALARLLEDGADGVERDVARAIRLYEFAVRKGSTDAMARLARILKDGRVGLSVPKGMAGAVQLLEQAARDGNSGPAMTALATMLEEGTQGVVRDPIKAMALYERAAEQEEDVKAMLHLARMLVEGSVERDVARAVRTLERAMDCGCPAALWKLANILMVEDEVRDEQRALDLFTELVSEEHYTTHAKMEIAWLLSGNSREVPTNAVKAAQLYEEILDEFEDVEAIHSLAQLLINGYADLPPDPVRAVSLYESAVTLHDSVPAMNALGLIYSGNLGHGIEKDIQKSIQMFERAAESGFVDARYNLARMLTVASDSNSEPIDLEHGMSLFQEMVDSNDHLWAMNNLARCCVPCEDEKGDEEKDRKSVARAASLLERAIRIGLQNSEGELRPLGIAPDEAFCVKNDEESEGLRHRALCRGAHIVAMVHLAELHVMNIEPKDVYKAVSLLERALANYEAPDVFENVTFNYEVLRQVVREANGDEELYRRVARVSRMFIERTAKTEPMCILAEMFVGGLGVPRSAEDAVKIYNRAITMGDKEAKLALGQLLINGAPGLAANRGKAFDLLTRVVAESGTGALAQTAVVDLAQLCTKCSSQRPALKS